MKAWIFLRNVLFVVAAMIGGAAVLAFLAASVTEWLLRPPAGWPVLAGIAGAFFGFVGGGVAAGLLLDWAKAIENTWILSC